MSPLSNSSDRLPVNLTRSRQIKAGLRMLRSYSQSYSYRLELTRMTKPVVIDFVTAPASGWAIHNHRYRIKQDMRQIITEQYYSNINKT